MAFVGSICGAMDAHHCVYLVRAILAALSRITFSIHGEFVEDAELKCYVMDDSNVSLGSLRKLFVRMVP